MIIDNKKVINIITEGKTVIRITDTLSGKVMYEKNTVEYFYLENETVLPNTITLSKTGTPLTTDLQYSYDAVDWQDVDLTASSTTYTLSRLSDRVYFRSTTGFSKYATDYLKLTSQRNYNVGGNILTLIDYRDVDNLTEIPDYSFYNLFNGSTYLTRANFDLGNATTIGDIAFRNAFYNCSKITEVPKFENFTTVGEYSFYNCFYGCTSLTTAPTFENVNTLERYSFTSCFYNCSSLTTAPKFDKIIKVFDYTFRQCFQNCKSLTEAPDFSNVTTVGTSGFAQCYSGCTALNYVYAPKIGSWNSTNFTNWLSSVAPSGTMKVSITTANIPTDNTSGIPSGWTTEYYEKFTTIYVANAPIHYAFNTGEGQQYYGGTTAKTIIPDGATTLTLQNPMHYYDYVEIDGQRYEFDSPIPIDDIINKTVIAQKLVNLTFIDTQASYEGCYFKIGTEDAVDLPPYTYTPYIVQVPYYLNDNEIYVYRNGKGITELQGIQQNDETKSTIEKEFTIKVSELPINNTTIEYYRQT